VEQGLLISCLDVPTLSDAIRLANEIGYRNVEISVCPDDKRPNLATLSHAQRRDARKLIDDLGMKISSLQCHIHNGYADENENTRNRAVDHTKRMLDLAASIGVDFVHTVSGIAEDDAPHDEKIDRVATCYREIFKHTAPDAPRLGIEPVFVYVIGNLAHTQTLYQRLDHLPLYVNFDPGHFPYHDQSPIPFIHEFAHKFVHAHSKDARVDDLAPGEKPTPHDEIFLTPDGKRKFYFVPPGQGVLQWDEIITEMRRAGFDGVLSLEMGHGYQGEPRDIARQVYEFFRTRYDLL